MKLFNIEFGFAIEKKGATPSQVQQVHGTRVLPLEKASALAEADGVVTTSREEIYVFTADCLPVLLFSEDASGPVSAVHAGWRGAKDGIVREALQFFPDSAKTHVVFGPALASCCFEVQQDFIDSFHDADRPTAAYLTNKDGRRFFSLVDFVANEDLKLIPAQNIHREYFRCTKCSSPQLPSYRRNKGTDPRLKNWIRKI